MSCGSCCDYVKSLCESTECGEKYRSIFELKQLGTEESVKALIENFDKLDDSDLLKHEVTYALGQMSQDFKHIIKPFLLEVLCDESEYAVVRHEAGEGLSNFAGAESSGELLPVFEKYALSEVPEVRGTCQIAVEKLKTYKELEEKYAQKYSNTREPAAPFTEEELLALVGEEKKELTLNEKIEAIALADDTSLFTKYRALYLLRDRADEASILLLAKLLDRVNWTKTNNLFRHEICFVLGQLGPAAIASVPQLKTTSLDAEENEIVRHEALSAYSSISEDTEFLGQFVKDPSRIVRESAIVALDLIKYWGSAAGCC